MKSPSWLAWLFSSLFIISVALIGHGLWPGAKNQGSTRVIVWDVSGYYLYLPAIFIHHDLQELRFHEQLLHDYAPTPDFQQAFRHPASGHYVMKYSAGMAVQYLPFFLVAHALSGPLGYPADGFSPPYQLALLIASLLVASLGLALVRRALLPRFGEWPTALTLAAIVLATNYLDYSAMGGAMTHNWLFTWYAGLLLLTPAFYRQPTMGRALAIGAVLGMMVLTRPTEILAILIPLLWGLRPAGSAVRERLAFWQQRVGLLLAALLAGTLIVSIQPLYWHYVSGDWVVYSYQEQGFSWLRPHLWDGIFSFKSGWLLYSPLLVVALAGFGALRRQQPAAFWPMLVFIVLFTYVAFAWDEWLYGGSLGQRAMVQTYAVLAWPWAAAHRWLLTRRPWLWAYVGFAVLGSYYNLWLTYQAHLGGLLVAGQMNRAYWWRILGRYDVPTEARLLLDTNYDFTGTPHNERVLWQENFEAAHLGQACGLPALQGQCSLLVDAAHPTSPEYSIPAARGQFQWLRGSALASSTMGEQVEGRMSQFVVRFCQGPQVVRERTVQFQRALQPDRVEELHFYVKAPREDFDRVVVVFLHHGPATVRFDNAQLVAFDE
ncbi:hypothetical protein [Hymenobacter negativus]|uniref:Glycosyltransferase RgtA/B/C/D-like domain-containing protein n=1 Tax=Hymenobacter negativus TaxID=2795026 RepID=A0ABS3QND0_9BACT|nr:hypothetical protein [Hymenobacter negativus]MBO2012746.1 hypothetical protein [Hymenobacter negativus]